MNSISRQTLSQCSCPKKLSYPVNGQEAFAKKIKLTSHFQTRHKQQSVEQEKSCDLGSSLRNIKRLQSNCLYQKKIPFEVRRHEVELFQQVQEIMLNLSIESSKEKSLLKFKVDKGDARVKNSIAFVIDIANKNGELASTIERIERIIRNFASNPSNARYQLSELVCEKYLENLEKSTSTENSGFLIRYKQLLEQRLELYKSLAERNHPCPIGSFGEKGPSWLNITKLAAKAG